MLEDPDSLPLCLKMKPWSSCFSFGSDGIEHLKWEWATHLVHKGTNPRAVHASSSLLLDAWTAVLVHSLRVNRVVF